MAHPVRGRTSAGLLGVAWLVHAVGVVLLVAAADDNVLRIAGPLPNLLLVVCGSIIVRRADVRSIGWALIVPGTLFPYYYVAETAAAGSDTVALEAFLGTGFVVVLPLLLMLLVFPTGRFPNRTARLLGLAAAVICIGGSALEVALILTDRRPDGTLVYDGLIIAIGILAIAALVNQALLYRHRTRTEQRQIKWFLLAIAGILVYPVAVVLDLSDDWFLVLDAISTSLWPITILIAITRYRLYEIDRIVSRTVAYLLVLGSLAAIFVGTVTLVTTILPTQDQFAVAATTIAVVALFNPLRQRVVRAVDRRFNRSRYVAQQVIEQFGRAIQDETDLDDVRTRVHGVIGDTVAPRTVAVWTRDT